MEKTINLAKLVISRHVRNKSVYRLRHIFQLISYASIFMGLENRCQILDLLYPQHSDENKTTKEIKKSSITSNLSLPSRPSTCKSQAEDNKVIVTVALQFEIKLR